MIATERSIILGGYRVCVGLLPAAACALVALAAASPQSRPSQAEADWPQWLGPDRSGVTSDKSNWPAGWPPRRLWDRNVGAGCTSPILAGGHLFVMGWEGDRKGAGTDTVYCFDAATGKGLWKQTYPCPRHSRNKVGDEGEYGGPSSTPAFDAKTKRLYTLSIDGDLRCWDAADGGRPVWSKNLADEYKVARRPDVGGGRRDYGFTSSPMVRDGQVIVEVGSRDGTVMAFDAGTGKRLWQSAFAEPAGHSSGPVPMMVQNTPCIATLALHKLVVLRIDKGNEGRTVAEYDWTTSYGTNIATPAVSGDKLLITSSYSQSRSCLLEVSLSGARQKWVSKANAMVSSPVVYKDSVYMINGAVQCLDLAGGGVKWRGGNFGHGSLLVTGDGKVLAFGNGKLALLDASPADNKYRELASVDRLVRDTCYPHLAMAGGLICVKDRSGNLVVLSVRGN